MPSFGPARPQNVRDLELSMNGEPVYLGVIVSSGAAVDNSTTATPFNFQLNGAVGASNQNSPNSYAPTLAGRVLVIQASAAGHILSSTKDLLTYPSATKVATFSTVPPAAGTVAGVKIQAEERVPFIMASQDGWLQFIPSSGSANLFVWELT